MADSEHDLTLDQFLDELLKRAAAKGYVPATFMRMRQSYGSIAAIRRLVETSKPQRGFARLQNLGLTKWCLESAVIRFAGMFTPKTFIYAQSRLDGLLDD